MLHALLFNRRILFWSWEVCFSQCLFSSCMLLYPWAVWAGSLVPVQCGAATWEPAASVSLHAALRGWAFRAADAEGKKIKGKNAALWVLWGLWKLLAQGSKRENRVIESLRMEMSTKIIGPAINPSPPCPLTMFPAKSFQNLLKLKPSWFLFFFFWLSVQGSPGKASQIKVQSQCMQHQMDPQFCRMFCFRPREPALLWVECPPLFIWSLCSS